MKINSTKKGFTLIELLIVIAIIGILAVNLLPNILNAPVRARDGARRGALTNLVSALETFNTDKGYYPKIAGCVEDSDSALIGYFSGGRAPEDPGNQGIPNKCDGNNNSGYYYCPVSGANQNYVLAARSELKDNATTTEAWVKDVLVCGLQVGNLAPAAPAAAPYAYTVIQ